MYEHKDKNPDQKSFITGLITAIAILAVLGGVYFAGQKFGGDSNTASIVQRSGNKEFNIIMQNNRYNPSRIQVNEGDRVVINFENRDQVSHGVGIAEFNATVPGGHIQPGSRARMQFVASRKTTVDAAVCGGPNPFDKTDAHGEELIIDVV